MFFDPEPQDELSGVLMFRVGRADEEPSWGGVSHLVEHLALHRMSDTEFDCNGTTGPLVTLFGATGTPDEVGGFLNDVSRALNDLPLERVPIEARILRTEALSRAPGLSEEALWFRFGNRGHGVRYMPELLLRSPSEERVRVWAADRFTAGNAALWFSGPPPAALDLKLPPGPRRPAPDSPTMEGISWPACVPVQAPRVGVSMIVMREQRLSYVLEIAVRRITRMLRHEQGVAYAVPFTYDALDRDTAFAGMWVDCLAQHVVAVRDGMLGTLTTLAKEGPNPEELAILGHPRRFADRPERRKEALANACYNELLGFPVLDPDEYASELQTLDPARLASGLGEALRTALVTLPIGYDAPPGFLMYPVVSRARVRGRVHRSVLARWPWSVGDELIVADDGVSWIQRGGKAITVTFPACAAAVLHPGDTLTLYGDDGFALTVAPDAWRDGARAVQRIVDRLPRGKLVDARAIGRG